MNTEPKSTARRDKTDEWDFRKPVSTEPMNGKKIGQTNEGDIQVSDNVSWSSGSTEPKQTPELSAKDIIGIAKGLDDAANGRTKPIEQIRRELAETAMTAEQFADQLENTLHDLAGTIFDLLMHEAIKHKFEQCAMHVREAAQGEIAGLQRGFVNIYHSVTDKDCDPKIGIGMSTSAVCQLKEKCETVERKLAELEKALQELVRAAWMSPPDWAGREKRSVVLARAEAVLASLRAESKEG